jgi:hypothetical protein
MAVELIAQKSAKNCMVIIPTEKTEPIATKHNTESVVAFNRSGNSERLVDSLLDLYRPQAEKTRWQMSSARTKIE